MSFVYELQKILNRYGYKLAEDGVLGPKTKAALDDCFRVNPQALGIDMPPIKNQFNAPWVFANIDLLGLNENDSQLNKRYVPEWRLEGLDYGSLAGNSHAWCSLRGNADRRKVGIKGTNSAAAKSWSEWGRKCPFWFGAALDIQHASGGRHMAEFLYWIDEKNRIAATLDGNRSNRFDVFETDLSGKGDKLVTGPRWPENWLSGSTPSKSEVLALYPFLKVSSKGGGTR